MRLVPKHMVIGLLKVPRPTVTHWHASNILPYACKVNGEAHYLESSINAFLARAVCGTPPITYEDLRSGRVELMTAGEATTLLGISRPAIAYERKLGRIGSIKVGGSQWRYLRTSVEEFRKKTRFTLKSAGHILGFRRTEITKLREEGTLVLVDWPHNLHYITYDSLKAFVTKSLPDWAKDAADEWIEERLASDRPLLDGTQAAHLVGVFRCDIRHYVTEQRILHIEPRARLRISPEAIDTFLGLEATLSAATIAEWFSVSPITVMRWRLQGLLQCPVAQHRHDPGELYESCFKRLIRPLLNCNQLPGRWVNMRKRQPSKLLTIVEAAAFTDMRRSEIKLYLETNKLRGIRTPGGHWRIRSEDTTTYKRQRKV